MGRLSRLAAKLRADDTPAALNGLGGFVASMLPVAAGFGWGLPLGFGPWLEIPIFLILLLVVLAVSGYMLAALLTVFPIALPRLTISVLLLGNTAAIVGFHQADMSWRLAIGLSLYLCLLGTGTGMIAFRYMLVPRQAVSRIAIILIVLVWFASVGWLLEAWPGEKPAYQQYAEWFQDGPAPPVIQADDPRVTGDYPIHTFTYASGTDRFRTEFGAEADLFAAPADATEITESWSSFRRWYWQTDMTALPLNGRVWMPQGKGPFPLVLIVHGNHLMEEFSDDGYAYLGEHFASRGFLTISVDQNFANYSVWSKGQQQNMFLREWGLLEHLRTIEQFHLSSGNLFSGKVDFARIALIGHSRGGQAVAMAADEGYHIQSIAALAPTDWRLNHTFLTLEDVDYLVLQGSQDADISTFDGERQFRRISFGDNPESMDDHFKAAVYIVGANHGQFNTGWGDRDITRPSHLLLNHRDLLPEVEQRQAALVYLTAFLETTLHDKHEYLPLFQDWRTAAEWLPETGYITQYMDSSFLVLEDYELASRGLPGVTSHADALIARENVQIRDRQGNSKQNRGAELIWDEAGGRYTLQLPEEGVQLAQPGNVLAFSLAAMPTDDSDLNAIIPDVTLEIQAANGEVSRIELDDHASIPPPVITQFTQHSLLEHELKRGRYRHPFEPVFQSFRIPLRTLQGWLSTDKPVPLQSITWSIEAEEPGRMLIDDIGIYPQAQ